MNSTMASPFRDGKNYHPVRYQQGTSDLSTTVTECKGNIKWGRNFVCVESENGYDKPRIEISRDKKQVGNCVLLSYHPIEKIKSTVQEGIHIYKPVWNTYVKKTRGGVAFILDSNTKKSKRY